jgi:hypothetical protein
MDVFAWMAAASLGCLFGILLTTWASADACDRAYADGVSAAEAGRYRW